MMNTLKIKSTIKGLVTRQQKLNKTVSLPQTIELNSLIGREVDPETGDEYPTVITDGYLLREFAAENAGARGNELFDINFDRGIIEMSNSAILAGMLDELSPTELLLIDWNNLNFSSYKLNPNCDLELDIY